MNISLCIKKAAVYNEVAKLTGYVGAKATEDVGVTYGRVFTTDDDRDMLERFWRESCNAVVDILKRFIVRTSYPKNSQTVDDKEVYRIELSMPDTYNQGLTPSVENALFSFYVNTITHKWFAITNKGDIEYYQNEALASINEVRRKIYYREKPVRMIPK